MLVNLATSETEEVGQISMDDILDSQIFESSSEVSIVEKFEEFSISKEDNSKQMRIWCGLEPEMKRSFKEFLRANVDGFAWKHSDMVGIDPQVSCHASKIDFQVNE
ncbi:Uncharacterized protein Adt_42212 [Abeliophyllum distichum]|uniref:Uncharacterized protein n=1 Tax=Abeliophyllum distichum TaxID=126358 RepID=A0ABD1PUZ0_9LAMI